MKLKKDNAVVFIPDGINEDEAFKRTTSLAISAHQDDIELMAYKGVLECFGLKDKWFSGIVTTDGAGSPRTGLYADYTDDEMKEVRIKEQNKAAFVGEYSSMVLLGYSSKEVKDSNNTDVIEDYVNLFTKMQPEIVYTHNLADKHDTHTGVVVKVIKALRQLPNELKPKKVYGCEVWRDLDWMCDEEKVMFDVSGHPNIAASLVSVFDSQICGGKRYDLAAQGRRTAYATYTASHGCDEWTGLSFGMDLTPLIYDVNLDIVEYVTAYIDRFKNDVKERLNKLI